MAIAYFQPGFGALGGALIGEHHQSDGLHENACFLCLTFSGLHLDFFRHFR